MIPPRQTHFASLFSCVTSSIHRVLYVVIRKPHYRGANERESCVYRTKAYRGAFSENADCVIDHFVLISIQYNNNTAVLFDKHLPQYIYIYIYIARTHSRFMTETGKRSDLSRRICAAATKRRQSDRALNFFPRNNCANQFHARPRNQSADGSANTT